MCTHPAHLTWNDLKLLRALRITGWRCPQCTPPDDSTD